MHCKIPQKSHRGHLFCLPGKHFLLLDTPKASSALHRDLAERLFMGPLITYAKTALTPDQYSKQYKPTWSFVTNELPPNVHLLTLEQREGTQYLIRLEHFYAEGEDDQLSKPVKINLSVSTQWNISCQVIFLISVWDSVSSDLIQVH